MIGQELTAHLQNVQKLLATLMSGYEDYQSRKSLEKEPSPSIPLKQHILYITGIVTAILIITLSLSAFLNAAKPIVFSIAAGQMVLAIGIYMIVMMKIIKDHHKRQEKSVVKVKSPPMSIHELDKLRFKILQNLAKSPIPSAHITPTSINKMLHLVESGMCLSLDECLSNIEKSTSDPKHIEELEIIERLQTISYH